MLCIWSDRRLAGIVGRASYGLSETKQIGVLEMGIFDGTSEAKKRVTFVVWEVPSGWKRWCGFRMRIGEFNHLTQARLR